MSQSPLAFSATNPAGATQSGRLGYQNELSTAQRHGADYAATMAGTVMFGANQTGATLSAALATTYTGLCLSNPAGSGKNLAVLNISGALLVAPTTITTLQLIAGYAAGGVTVHTTALTPLNALLNGSAPVAKLDAAATIVGTPAFVRTLGQAPTATTAFSFSHNINGGIIIPPGGYVAIGANIAGPASGFVGSFAWEEIGL